MVLVDLDDEDNDICDDIDLEDISIEHDTCKGASYKYQCFTPPYYKQSRDINNFYRSRPSVLDSFGQRQSKQLVKKDDIVIQRSWYFKQNGSYININKSSPEMTTIGIVKLKSGGDTKLFAAPNNAIYRNETSAYETKKNRSKRLRIPGNEPFAPLATIVENIGDDNDDSDTNNDIGRLCESYITVSTTDSESDSDYYNECIVRDENLQRNREYIDLFDYDEFLHMIRSYRNRIVIRPVSTNIESSPTNRDNTATSTSILREQETRLDMTMDPKPETRVPITSGDIIFIVVTIVLAIFCILSAAYLDSVYETNQKFDSINIKAGLNRNQTYLESDNHMNRTWISDELFLSNISLHSSKLYAGCTKDNAFVQGEGNTNRKWSSSLFCNERWFSSNVSASYNIPVLKNDATYLVQLYFNELYYNSSNSRRFKIVIEEKVVKTNFDIYAEAGAEKYSVVIIEHQQLVKDGVLTVVLQHQTSNVKINAMSVTLLPHENITFRPNQRTIEHTKVRVNHFTPVESLFVKPNK
jgi:Malectin domain